MASRAYSYTYLDLSTKQRAPSQTTTVRATPPAWGTRVCIPADPFNLGSRPVSASCTSARERAPASASSVLAALIDTKWRSESGAALLDERVLCSSATELGGLLPTSSVGPSSA